MVVTPEQVVDTFPGATVFGANKPLFCYRCDPDLPLEYSRLFNTAPVSKAKLVAILDKRRGRVIERVRPVEWGDRSGENEWACHICGRAVKQVSQKKKGPRGNVTRKRRKHQCQDHNTSQRTGASTWQSSHTHSIGTDASNRNGGRYEYLRS